jgi:plastocyanin
VAGAVGAAVALGQSSTASVTANANNTFSPTPVTITAGGTVTWSNMGGGNHNVHFNDQAAALNSPSTSNWTTSRTFPTAGTFTYHCDIHTFMQGTVNVVAASTTTPGSTTPAPAPGGGTPPTGSTPTPADTTAPTATQLRASGTLRRTVVRLRLSEKATVTARLRRRGSSRTLARVTRSLDAGNARLTIRKRLTAGKRYRVALTITDAAGNVTRRTVSFTAHR